MPRLLVLADSLRYFGPDGAVPPRDSRLYPNLTAARLRDDTGSEWQVDLIAGLGWTMRDGWWALTKDPRAWGEALPRADAVVVGLGGMDALPAAMPTYLREGMAYLRPGTLRRAVRKAYATTVPTVIRWTGGPLRQLPQGATDRYATRIVDSVRYWRPGVPIVVLSPPPYDSRYYPSTGGHAKARTAAFAWAEQAQVSMVDADEHVGPGLLDGSHNADGMHFGGPTHARVGAALGAALGQALRSPLDGEPGGGYGEGFRGQDPDGGDSGNSVPRAAGDRW